jgi:hypothetical protein
LQAVQQENQLHALKLKNIQQQQQAQASSNGTDTTSTNAKPNGGLGGAADPNNVSNNSAGFGDIHFTINIDTAIGSDLSKVGEQIGPGVLKYLQALQARSTGPILTKR